MADTTDNRGEDDGKEQRPRLEPGQQVGKMLDHDGQYTRTEYATRVTALFFQKDSMAMLLQNKTVLTSRLALPGRQERIVNAKAQRRRIITHNARCVNTVMVSSSTSTHHTSIAAQFWG